ncbi:MAG: glycosyltransferase [Actinomycetota bacterium]
MARIVIIPTRIRAVSSPHLELARRLVEAGHEVHYIGPPASEGPAAEVGAAFIELQGLALHEWLPPGGSTVARLVRFPTAWRGRTARLDEQVDRFEVDRAQATLRTLAPDLVVTDHENFAQLTAARVEGIRALATTTWSHPFKRRNKPPLDTSVVPGRGVIGSTVGIELVWLRHRLRRLAWGAFAFVRDGGADLASIQRHMVRRHGLSPRHELDPWQWLRPAYFRRVPHMGLSFASFDFPGDDHPSFHRACAIIPTIDDGRIDGELRVFVDANAATGRPLLYLSMGAFAAGSAADLMRRALDGLAGRPDWDVVVGLGGGDPAELESACPDNVLLVGFAPQLELLARADVAVVHGGINSMNEALRHGTPIVNYPFPGVMDQEGTGARVVAHQVGVVGDRGTDTAEQIVGRIQAVLTDPMYRTNAERMANAMADEEVGDPPVRVVESFLEEAAP